MIQKQGIPINFAKGLDQKTDPFQVQMGNFLSLQNSVFIKGGRLQKRNGYGILSAKSPVSSYITTFKDNLISIGSTLNSYSPGVDKWVQKGGIEPCSLSVFPVVRNNLNQIYSDSVTASNGLSCVVYTEQSYTFSSVVNSFRYVIVDSETGQSVVSPSDIPAISTGVIAGSARVFIVGIYFVIVCPVTASSVTSLQYVAIPFKNPTAIGNPQTVSLENYAPISSNPSWDGVSYNNNLVIAYNSTSMAQGIHIAALDLQQIANNQRTSVIYQFNDPAYVADVLSVCVSSDTVIQTVFVSFHSPTNNNTYTLGVTVSPGTINPQFFPSAISLSMSVVNIASAAISGTARVYLDIQTFYGFDSTIPTRFINCVHVGDGGSVGSATTIVRSVGLASKAFVIDEKYYFLASFDSQFQPSYFLINASNSLSSSPVVTAKLAYQNGGGSLTNGLPSVSIDGFNASVTYRYKDDVEALNTLNNTQQTTAGGIYSQTGINLAKFVIGTEDIASSEIADSLNITGGFLGMFDGNYPVEQNFFIWPEPIKCLWTSSSVMNPTGSFSSGANQIVLSSVSGIYPGMTVKDTTNPSYIPDNTSILYITGSVITISNKTTGISSGDSLSIQGNIWDRPTGATSGDGAYYYIATYEWTDNQGLPHRSTPSIPFKLNTTGTAQDGITTVFVPTLRLTYKVKNPVKIVIYRWSVATQVYNQVTSITSPVLNDPTVDYVTFVDTLSDANVVGNNILYTTGGVVPDVNAPATGVMTVFDTRLFLVSSEDPNTLWLSKNVLQGTPVEMSSNFTISIQPNIGTTNSTGPITAIFPMDDKLILFKKNAIFYITGTGPNPLGTTSLGSPIGNYSQPIFITSVVGCDNPKSIVLTNSGLMFQSDKGIWLLNRGLGAEYIGAPVEGFNSSRVNSAKVIPGTNYVLFTLGTGQTLMFDYYYNQWGTFVGFLPLSSCIYNGKHTILDKYGRILQETPGLYVDGSSNPVLMSFLTGHIDVTGISGYERIFEIILLGQYVSPHLLDVKMGFNFGSLSEQVTIHPNNYTGSYGSDDFYGQTTPFGGPGALEQWRIQPATQKCQAFQFSLNELYDPSYGQVAGAGFTLSAMTCVMGVNKSYRPVRAANTAGTSSR